jgi:hypothetical protein
MNEWFGMDPSFTCHLRTTYRNEFNRCMVRNGSELCLWHRLMEWARYLSSSSQLEDQDILYYGFFWGFVICNKRLQSSNYKIPSLDCNDEATGLRLEITGLAVTGAIFFGFLELVILVHSR